MSARYSENTYWFHIVILMLIFGLHSCSPSRYLTDDQTLLKGNKLEFHSPDEIKNKDLLLSQLNAFMLQKPNGRLLGLIPRQWIFHINSQENDDRWYNNFARNYWGETPSIYNHEESISTAINMQKYLRNKKGFFHAEVALDTSKSKYKTELTYNVNAGRRYYINSLKLIGKDTNIVEILKRHEKNSLLSVGDPLDASIFDLEKTRMVNLLQNMGYTNFAGNYIDIKGDSTGLDHKVDVFLDVYPPAPGKSHRKYYVGKVNVNTDYFRGLELDSLYKEKIGDYTYYGAKQDFIVDPSVLAGKIFLKPGEIVRKDDRLNTYNSLSKLGSYRFVSLNSYVDESSDSLINFDVLLTAHKNKWFSDYGADIFYSSISARNINIFGYSVSSAFNNRNALGGSERFTLATEFGQELQLNPLQSRTISLSVQSSLVFPREVNLLGMSSVLRAVRLLSEERQKKFKEQAQTSISAGARVQRIRDFYNETDVGIAFGYNFADNRRRLSIRQTAVNLNISTLQDTFLNQIGNNPAIINSFQNYLTTGLFLRDITYNYNSRVFNNGFSWAYIINAGQSGFETWLANKAYNAIASKDGEWSIGGDNGVNFAKFLKLTLDLRAYKKLTEGSNLASRFYLGIAKPFGGDNIVPFNEQFSVGGPTSLRGWDQQELGPGGYIQEIIENQLFYQKGDVKLEANLEYRFDMFGLPGSGKLEGGLFVDAGNIWLLEEDPERVNAKLSGKFLDQIAVAAGWGLRFDFDYFLIRFDFGYKLRNSFENTYGNHWQSFNQVRRQGRWGFGNMQVGINHAF